MHPSDKYPERVVCKTGVKRGVEAANGSAAANGASAAGTARPALKRLKKAGTPALSGSVSKSTGSTPKSPPPVTTAGVPKCACFVSWLIHQLMFRNAPPRGARGTLTSPACFQRPVLCFTHCTSDRLSVHRAPSAVLSSAGRLRPVYTFVEDSLTPRAGVTARRSASGSP